MFLVYASASFFHGLHGAASTSPVGIGDAFSKLFEDGLAAHLQAEHWLALPCPHDAYRTRRGLTQVSFAANGARAREVPGAGVSVTAPVQA